MTLDVSRWAGSAPKLMYAANTVPKMFFYNKVLIKFICYLLLPETVANPDVIIEWSSELVKISIYGFMTNGASVCKNIFTWLLKIKHNLFSNETLCPRRGVAYNIRGHTIGF